MIYEQICCSSYVRFSKVPYDFLIFICLIPCLACHWDGLEGSWVFVLPTDVSPHALLWAPQVRDHLSKSEPLCSALKVPCCGYLLALGCCHSFIVLCFTRRDPSAEKVCDFHGVSLKFNSSLSVSAPEYIICLCQMTRWSVEFWQPVCGIAWLLNRV